ncbi:MAG: FHA domain-containing protein, partial [Candidatus Zixiibacteriota bacterium]
MPVFTISKGGKTLETLSLDGDRIEMGSANACRLFIDDLLISLKQAAFVRSGDGYDLEPLSRTPVVKVNGEPVTQRVKVPTGAVIEVEGYQI